MQHASPLFSSLSLSLPYDALFRSTRRTASVMVLSAKGGVVGVWWIDHVDHCLAVVASLCIIRHRHLMPLHFRPDAGDATC